MVNIAKPKDFQDTKQLPREEIMLEIGRIAIVSAAIEDLLHELYGDLLEYPSAWAP